MTEGFLKEVEIILSQQLQKDIKIKDTCSVSGGCINQAWQLITNQGNFFIKINQANSYPQMFEKEVRGLSLLADTNTIKIPEVITVGEFDETSYLIMEWIESNRPQIGFWENFGKQLAQLHRNTADFFGGEEVNYIGSLQQSNQLHKTWAEFFIHERLQIQLKMAIDIGKMDHTVVAQFESFYRKLTDIFPEESPALLHGDLWSGNYMVGNHGEPVIMDPAVYYGHREMDLAMTRLFGGFDHQMYQAYHEEYPLIKGWEERMDICNLYPLLVHVNLFGEGYVQQIKSILKKIT